MKYVEFGIGNQWLLSTEVEHEDGTEARFPGVLPLGPLQSFYIRIWIGRDVFILSTNEGFVMKTKGRDAFKALLGLSAE